MPNYPQFLTTLLHMTDDITRGTPPQGVTRSPHTRKHITTQRVRVMFAKSQSHSCAWLCKCEYKSFTSTTNVIIVIIVFSWYSFPLIETKFCFDAMVETRRPELPLSVASTKLLKGSLYRPCRSTGRAKGWHHYVFLSLWPKQSRKKGVWGKDTTAAMPSCAADFVPVLGRWF